MNKLFTLISVKADELNENIVALIRLNPDHPVFQGHFPGNPILPGVCTVQISKELLEKITDKELMLIKSGNIKYLGFVSPVIHPEMQFNLAIKASETGGFICSSIVSAGGNTVCSFKGEYRIVTAY